MSPSPGLVQPVGSEGGLLKAAGLAKPAEWTVRELLTSFVSLMSEYGKASIEVIARVVGHRGTATTERVYRKQLRPVITEGVEAMDTVFGGDQKAATRTRTGPLDE
ncbi:hypothetical protein GCM10023335_34610 [Streptomyces siamensis]|uniref:Integrase n=1 Tax=Streptomyces siamensis TaxID=1274986 RepID=A0ABP9IW76_9ACTN